MRYTFYVFRPEVKAFEEVLAPGSLRGQYPFEPLAMRDIPFTAEAYLQRNKPSTPAWVDFINQLSKVEKPSLIKNRYNSFILIIKTKNGRMCALTYGQGYQSLNRAKVQQDFGLDAACRLLDSKTIKEIETKAAGSDGLHKHQIASKPGDLATFPLQRARDRVNRLGGKSPDDDLGNRITGGTSCMIAGKLPFETIGAVCERLVASVSSKAQPRLDALRPFEPVNEHAIIKALEKRFLEALAPGKCDSIGLFLPDTSSWSAVEHFEATWDRTNWHSLDDLELDKLVDQARKDFGKKLTLESMRVRAVSDGGIEVFDVPITDLATFETDHDGKAYALSGGKWHLLRQHFVDRFNKDFANIEVETASGYLPDWTTEPTEYDYNSGVANANPKRFHCLDQDLVRLNGENIEPCDLVTVDGHFIHVKKWSSSQTFSALIKQGQNAAQLIDASQEFRDGVFAKLPNSWKTKPYWKRFKGGLPPREIRIVYAIAAKAKRTIPGDIPIFSRQSLLDACGNLRAQYYNVRVVHVRQR